MNAIIKPVETTQEPPSVIASMASRYGMDKRAFEATLRATIMPKDCSNEQVAAFLVVAKQYELNPFVKEIFAFPSRGGIQAIVSIDGWMKLINSHPQFDGMDFYDHHEDDKLVSIKCTIHRKDRSHPIEVTEYMSECYRKSDTWDRWPARMLRHKAAIQAARYAFGFAGIMEPDEAERLAEVEQVQAQRVEPTQDERDEQKRIACMEASQANAETVKTIKDCIAAADAEEDEDKARDWLLQVRKAWYELPNDTQIALYSCAPTKGGIFTTHERDVIKSKLPLPNEAQA
jgi:phage recombination protein Bet